MKFGLDRTDITPGYRTFFAGYGLRDVSDGVNDPLTFTALVLEEGGRRVMIGAVDLVSLGREHSVRLRRKIAQALGTEFSAVMINCSHTHGGILVSDLPEPGNPVMREHRRKNRRHIERRILASVERAASRLKEGTLHYGEGRTEIPMNRRLLHGGVVDNRPNPAGRVDDALKLLALRDAGGGVAAIIARVSCHPVATGARHLVTADFPGAFRRRMESLFPGATAVFLQGVGADARPGQVARGDDWFAMEHADLPLIGDHLAAETMAVLAGGGMKPLGRPRFRSALEVVELPLADPGITRRRLREQMLLDYVPAERWKAGAIGNVLAMKKFHRCLPLAVQMVSFGPRFSILGVEAEVLCGMGAKLEKAVSSEFRMTLGYTNGARCYLPDREEHARGGYEVDAYLLEMLPSPISPGAEDILVGVVAGFDRRLNRRK